MGQATTPPATCRTEATAARGMCSRPPRPLATAPMGGPSMPMAAAGTITVSPIGAPLRLLRAGRALGRAMALAAAASKLPLTSPHFVGVLLLSLCILQLVVRI